MKIFYFEIRKLKKQNNKYKCPTCNKIYNAVDLDFKKRNKKIIAYCMRNRYCSGGILKQI